MRTSVLECGNEGMAEGTGSGIRDGEDLAGEPVTANADEAPKGRVVNIVELAEITGYHRDTLSEWIRRKGLPVEKDGWHGVGYHIDVRKFIDWRETQARTDAVKNAPKAVAGGFEGWMGMTDPNKAAQAMDRFSRVGERLKDLVPRAPMVEAQQRANGIIRQAVMSIPDRICRDMAGFPPDLVDRWRDKAKGYCAGALGEGAKAVDQAMRDHATRRA